MTTVTRPEQAPLDELDDLCVTLTARLRGGERASAELVLASRPDLAADADTALELIYTEFLTRLEHGDASTPEQWVTRFPRFRDELHRLFQLHELLYADATESQIQTLSQHDQLGWGGPLGRGGRSRRLGPFLILTRLNAGSMGVVYKARDTRSARVVALKVLHGGWAGTPEARRFPHEVEAARRLRHPHIVEVFDAGQVDGSSFLAMRFAEGGSLAQQMGRFTGDPRAAASLVARIARAVHHAHARGILHRDLKPGNILLDAADEPLVADFGLAKLLDASTLLTQDGDRLGTPAYMAPEQVAGAAAAVGPAADIWALGVILYELLAGRRPFTAGRREQLFRQISDDVPLPVQRFNLLVDPELAAICHRCLEKAPAARPASAQALAEALEEWLQGEPLPPPPASWPERASAVLGRVPPRTALAALVVLLGFLGLTVGATTVPFDAALNKPSADPVQVYLADLEKGKMITLVGPTGLPKSYNWRGPVGFLGGTVPCLHLNLANRFASLAKLELLPHTAGRAYHLRAELRHVSTSTPTGTCGIFFGLKDGPGQGDPESCYISVRFSDLETAAAVGRQEHECWVRLEGCRHWLVPRAVPGKTPTNQGDLRHHRLPAQPGSWRAIEASVTPQKMTVWFDGVCLGDVWWEEVRTMMERFDGPWLAGFDGALGVYGRNSSVAFRNVTVTPLPAEK